MQITSDQAVAVMRGALVRARQIGIEVSIVVLDGAGHLKAFSRMGQAWRGSVDVAIKKAKTSVVSKSEVQDVLEVCKPDAQAPGLALANDGLVAFEGAIPLKSTEGQLMGAIGVSGGQVTQDRDVALAGYRAFIALERRAFVWKRGMSPVSR